MSPLVVLAILLVTVSAAPSQTNPEGSRKSVSKLDKRAQDAEEGTSQQDRHHRQKRSPGPPIALLVALEKSGGGQKQGDLSKAPPIVRNMLQMGRAGFNGVLKTFSKLLLSQVNLEKRHLS